MLFDEENLEQCIPLIKKQALLCNNCNLSATQLLNNLCEKEDTADKDFEQKIKDLVYCYDIKKVIENFKVTEPPQINKEFEKSIAPIYGAIFGDIVGSKFEGVGIKYDEALKVVQEPDDIGCLTDDSVLTIATYQTIKGNGALSYENKTLYLEQRPLVLADISRTSTYPFKTNPFVAAYRNYGRKYPGAGYGSGFIDWMESENQNPYGSYGNGSAMRISPIGCYYKTQEDVIFLATMSAASTHNHFEGIKGAVVTAMSIWMALNGYSKKQILAYVKHHYSYGNVLFTNFTMEEVKLPLQNNSFAIACQYTVPVAIICFIYGENYDDCVAKAMSATYDVDTTAAICGGIAAAYYGLDNSKVQFVEQKIRNTRSKY